jgi:hypothetical protein
MATPPLDLNALQRAIDGLKEERLAVERDRLQVEKLKEVVELNLERFKDRVKLNVGGVKFETTLRTLQRQPNSMLATMFSGIAGFEVTADAEGYVFIDRGGEHFGAILDLLRTGELAVPTDERSRLALGRELGFYLLTLPPGVRLQPTSGYTREDVKAHLLAGKSLSHMDLAGLDLSGLCFPLLQPQAPLSFSKSLMTGWQGLDTSWQGANFADANLSNAWFLGEMQPGVGGYTVGAFKNAKLDGARLHVSLFKTLDEEARKQSFLVWGATSWFKSNDAFAVKKALGSY